MVERFRSNRTGSCHTLGALAGAWSDCDIYIGSEFRIDVSSEAGSRFDQSITGFRGEEEFGFSAEPYVRTGKFREDPGTVSRSP